MRLKVNNISHDIVNYVIPTHKLKFGEERKVVLIADLHGYHNNPKKREALVEAIRLQNPHHIIIAGDLMNAASGRWTNDTVYDNLCEFIYALSEIAPVYISQGNHDINAKGEMQEAANKRFMDLAKLNPGRIFPLINGSERLDEFEILGFTPKHSTMADLGTQTHGIARDLYVDEFNANGPEIVGGDDTIVEMVGHNPHVFGVGESDKDLGRAKGIDTFYAGHWHNAYRSSMETRNDPEKYMSGNGYTEKIKELRHDGTVESYHAGWGPVDSLARGVTFTDDMSQQEYLQLRSQDDKDVQYYSNTALNKGKNIKEWARSEKESSEEDLMNKRLHNVVVTGGVKKFSPIPFPDEPEVTVVNYSGRKK